MKLLIQIPCYNEAATIGQVLAGLPRRLDGFERIETLVIDDGSQDDSAQVAAAAGADHVLRLGRHAGLAAAFAAGLDACLQRGADVIVNIDADGQYDPADLPALLAPILAGQAGLVVGDRQAAGRRTFTPLKSGLQRLGSAVVSRAAGLPIPDAASGLRALTRQTALRTIVLSEYSYTLETLIQAGAEQTAVAHVAVQSHPTARPSRLMRSLSDYLLHSVVIILHAYTRYRPLHVFSAAGGGLLLGGLALALRYLVFFFQGQGQGHVQSVILAAVLLIAGFQTLLIGLVADLIAFNRRLLEDVLYRLRRLELGEPPREPRP